MSEQETEAQGSQYDAPNQQVVRPDGSGPADEGEGGSGGAEPRSKKKTETKSETKSESKSESKSKKDEDK